ncbi:MAG: PEP-CTERM sorting domain-containing protein [Thermoguttaceae bacterium]
MLSRFSWALAIAIAAIASSARAEILFSDNFNSTGDASAYSDYGLNQEQGVRQSGTYAGTLYRNPSYSQFRDSKAPQVNNASHAGALAFIQGAGDWCSGFTLLNRDFGVGAQGIQVSVTTTPDIGTGWSCLGMLGGDYSPGHKELPSATDVGAVLLVKAGGGWNFASNGSYLLGGSVTPSTTYDLTMQVTNNGSGNVLNAWIGSTQIVTDYALTGAAATRTTNYISIGAQLCTYDGAKAYSFDNLTVQTAPVPEPGTLALLAAGLIGLVAYAWRKR